jgi:hypothetical protein
MNEVMLGKMVDAMDQPSAIGNALRALQYIRAPRPTPVAGTAAKQTLTFGDAEGHPDTAIEVAVLVSKCVMPVSPMSQKKMSTLSGMRGRNVVEPSLGMKRKRALDDDQGRERDRSGLSGSLGASQLASRYAESQTQTQTYASGGSDKRPWAPREYTFGINSDRKYLYAPEKERPESLHNLGRNGIRSASQARLEDARADAASTDDEDDDEAEPTREEVPEGVELVKAYKYGATRVPLNGIDENELILAATPGLQVLGFAQAKSVRSTSSALLRPATRMDRFDGSTISAAPGGSLAIRRAPGPRSPCPSSCTPSSRRTLSPSSASSATPRMPPPRCVRSTLASSRTTRSKRARIAGRALSCVRCALPSVSGGPAHRSQLPFVDDIRDYAFPSLTHLVSKSGKVLEEHRNLPTDEMNIAMRHFVEQNLLDDADRDEDGYMRAIEADIRKPMSRTASLALGSASARSATRPCTTSSVLSSTVPPIPRTQICPLCTPTSPST